MFTDKIMPAITTENVLRKYEEIHEIYSDAESRAKLAIVEQLLFEGKFALAEIKLKEFRDEKQLMELLERKLTGKPIHNTLKKIRKGTVESKAQILKGLFSLGTHAAIELESGNNEYLYITKRIHEKLGTLLNA